MFLPAPGPRTAGASLPTLQVWVTHPPLDGAFAPVTESTTIDGAIASGTAPSELFFDAVPQGGATASGNGPVAVASTAQGGAVASGLAPTARTSAPQGGAVADGR